jgi:hypothetical protein
MADSIKERMTTGWQQIKLEGGNRLIRIRDLQTKPEAATAPRPLTAQTPEPQPLVVEMPVVPTATPVVTQTQATESETPILPPVLPMGSTTAPVNTSPAPSSQTASQVATTLRVTYAVAKAGWQGASDWYQQARLQAATEPQTPNPLEQKQAIWETRAGELGTQAARKEQQIRQRVKQFLQTAAERL